MEDLLSIIFTDRFNMFHFSNFSCNIAPIANVKKNIGNWEQQHTDFIYQSNSFLSNMHTKWIAVNAELQLRPELAKRADLFDVTICLLRQLKHKNMKHAAWNTTTTPWVEAEIVTNQRGGSFSNDLSISQNIMYTPPHVC